MLEDNLRCPSGVSYVLENRQVLKRTFPQVFEAPRVRAVDDYPSKLLAMLEHLAPDHIGAPTIGVLTPGIYNSAYFEHSFLFQQMGVELVEGQDLVVSEGFVHMLTTKGLKRVDVLYRVPTIVGDRIEGRHVDLRPYIIFGKLSSNSGWRAGRTFDTGKKISNDKIRGLMDCTMRHGEAWNFACIGMMIERTDETSRVLDVKYFMLLPRADLVNSPIDNIQWTAVLKSASVFEMFRKQHHQITPRGVADFLIFDREFPRAIHHCIVKAMICQHRITDTAPGSVSNPVEKQLGRLKADLDYADIDEVIGLGMHEYLDGLQIRLNLVDTAIGTTFFNFKPEAEPTIQEQ